jgi:hypothetical protein
MLHQISINCEDNSYHLAVAPDANAGIVQFANNVELKSMRLLSTIAPSLI